MRRLLLPLLLPLLPACLTPSSGDELDGGFGPCDAGNLDNGDAEVIVDAGECAIDIGFADGEGEGEGAPVGGDPADCPPLLVKTCGADGECQDDPGCVAADLTSRFEPLECTAALADNRSYPSCSAGACDRLVVKVCGDPATCADAPGCQPAETLQERADEGDVSAEASCGTALSDEALFPRCN